MLNHTSPHAIDNHIRPATRVDLPAILEIYNYAVRELNASFDTVEKTLAEREVWFAAHGERYPVFVAVAKEQVVGWASLSPYSDRPAYGRTVENSVYVHHEHWGRGIGGMLMAALMAVVVTQGFHVVIARIAGGNEASIRLHQRFGFTEVGVMHEAGWKFERWHDVVIMERVIGQ